EDRNRLRERAGRCIAETYGAPLTARAGRLARGGKCQEKNSSPGQGWQGNYGERSLAGRRGRNNRHGRRAAGGWPPADAARPDPAAPRPPPPAPIPLWLRPGRLRSIARAQHAAPTKRRLRRVAQRALPGPSRTYYVRNEYVREDRRGQDQAHPQR